MTGFFHIPRNKLADIQEFTVPSTSTTQWHTWMKPRGVSMVSILCIGGGGGGGGGAVPSNAGGGGGGGGSSSQTSVLIQAQLLPDSLYVQVGAGGAGGVTGVTAATNGALSYVSVDYTTTGANNIVCVSGTVAASAGSVATATNGGGNGSGGTVATISIMPLGGLGIYNFVAGQAGTAGGGVTSGAAAPNITLPLTGLSCMGGTGGGGTTGVVLNPGGAITSVGSTLFGDSIPINASGGQSGSGSYNIRGTSGIFFTYSGMGSGGNTKSNAGLAGGNGLYGSGGGGGGSGSPGGTGGRGGNGIVIITSW